jgi:hypothetical protein
MAFSDFHYPEVLPTFGLQVDTSLDLFAQVPDVATGPALEQTLRRNAPLALTVNTEKARSEGLIAPLLFDFWHRYQGRISLFSGAEFNVDPAAGLSGYCDFLLCRAPQQPMIIAPVVVIFEAKRENIQDGLGQCVAGMVAAQRFNQRADNGIDAVYGSVTTGSQWKFLRLHRTLLTLDLSEYSIVQTDRLLGILTHIVGPMPQPAAAA